MIEVVDATEIIELCMNVIDRLYECKFSEDETSTNQRVVALGNAPNLCGRALHTCLLRLEIIYDKLSKSQVLEGSVAMEARLYAAAVTVLAPNTGPAICQMLNKNVEHKTLAYKNLCSKHKGLNFVITGGKLAGEVGYIASIIGKKIYYRRIDKPADIELPSDSKLLLLKLV
jgi:hypothetical protein